ncbi:bifunctional adenosylcobinamide kinase/adenosylcobinamide-phosphate guanylyltransferase [Lysinibacillus sp. 54212]|uniref:bifunctional adenosylcobinamide kinase/adenosylcobinamide-phosphate guanylyltransferase n=1 Tax=Lysinibacillus sp. 54212 TaxID=3119829 RepID=UPI002FC60CE8
MQVYIGGAYNGKRQFVMNKLASIPKEHVHFFDGIIPESSFTGKDYVILMNFEKLSLQYKGMPELVVAQQVVDRLSELEQQTNVICICTDIGRGIVPLNPTDRFVRDCCGRIYQRLFQEARSVTRIWYGIPEKIKGEL